MLETETASRYSANVVGKSSHVPLHFTKPFEHLQQPKKTFLPQSVGSLDLACQNQVLKHDTVEVKASDSPGPLVPVHFLW